MLIHSLTSVAANPHLVEAGILRTIRNAVLVIIAIVFIVGFVLGFLVGKAFGRGTRR